MKRICPSCNEKGISILPLMLWATRCKHCDTKVRINQFWSLILNTVTISIFVFFIIVSYNYFGFKGIGMAFVIYIASIFVVEMAGPLVISSPPR